MGFLKTLGKIGKFALPIAGMALGGPLGGALGGGLGGLVSGGGLKGIAGGAALGGIGGLGVKAAGGIGGLAKFGGNLLKGAGKQLGGALMQNPLGTLGGLGMGGLALKQQAEQRGNLEKMMAERQEMLRRGLGQAEAAYAERAPLRQASVANLTNSLSKPQRGVFG